MHSYMISCKKWDQSNENVCVNAQVEDYCLDLVVNIDIY